MAAAGEEFVTESHLHGSIGEEAVRLLDAVQEWLRRNVNDPATARISTGTPECAWCPICQLIVGLRGDRPELADKIAEATTSLVTALRAVVDAVTPTPPPPGAPRVQHIDLSGEAAQDTP